MNGGIVPFLLMSATLALLLGFLSLGGAMRGGATFVVAAGLGFAAPKLLPLAAIFHGLWISLIVTAVLVYLPSARWRVAALPLAANDGLWLGAAAALTGSDTGMAIGLVPLLLVVPARWIVARDYAIMIKVIASWMIAIASLSMFVSLVATPGYKPDHME